MDNAAVMFKIHFQNMQIICMMRLIIVKERTKGRG